MQELLRRLLFLPPEATETARQIDRLHFFVIGVTFAGAIAVGLVSLAFVVQFRAVRENASTPVVHVPRRIELGVAGALLALFIAWWVVGFRQYVAIHTPPRESLEVYVTAKQWMWKFSRTNGQRSAGVLVVPEGRPVRLILTSRDVVHSFFVPAFRIKQDALPGRYTSLWFDADKVGTYPVYCAEYCGVDHSRMWASVVVLSPSDYSRWLAGGVPDAVAHAGAQPDLDRGVVGEAGLTSLADRGRTAASRYACLSCHTIDGQRHVGPSFQGLYRSSVALADGRTVVADEDYLTRSMMEPRADLVKGFTPVMPTYQGVVEQADVAALVEFIKSLRFDTARPRVMLPGEAP
jgi:cytochrome c oxidase subunit 2